MAPRDTFWYGLGRSAERLTSALSRSTSEDRAPDTESSGERAGHTDSKRDPTELILMTGLSAAAVSALRRWADGRRPGFGSLVRGALAGAGAAACIQAVRMLRGPASGDGGGEGPSEILDGLLGGAGRGLIYASILDPLLPGPPIARGALAGTAEYLAAPLGGVFSHLETVSPIRRVPFISVLLETGDAEEDEGFLSFLAFSIILAALYGDAGSGSGTP